MDTRSPNISIKRKVTKSVSYVALSTLGIILLRSVFVLILVRLVGVEEFGDYSVVMSVITVCIALVSFGTPIAIQKYVSECQRQSKAKVQEIVGASLGVSVMLASSALLFFVSLNFMRIYVSPGIADLLALGIWIVALSVLFENLRAVLFALHREEISETWRLVMYLIYFALGSVILLKGGGIAGVFQAYIGGLVFVIIFYLNAIRRMLDLDLIVRGFRNFSFRILNLGKWVTFGIVLAEILYQADILMVRYLKTSADAGYYKAALVTAQFVWLIPRILQDSLLPTVSELWSQSKAQEVSILLSRGAKYIYLTVLLVGGILFVFAESFIALYFGSEYLAAATPVRILMAGTLCFSLSRIYSPLLQATEALRANVACGGGATVANIILNLLLIPSSGIVGAAVATSISYGLYFILMTLFVELKLKVPVVRGISVYRALMLLVSYITLLVLVRKFFSTIGPALLVLAIMASGVILLILALRTHFIDKVDLTLLPKAGMVRKLVRFVGG